MKKQKNYSHTSLAFFSGGSRYISGLLFFWLALHVSFVAAQDLPIADAHVHYSHDSVEMTPPERVIEIMREANLKFALVSSSDDNGTQLLSALAPDLIVPGLRPYRRRGELGSWFTDPDALAYVEKLLASNHYASIGEFHLSGATPDLPIPRKIVALAAQHNLILHAHSDAEAIERLLAQDDTVKVLWAHSGFENPDEIAAMLSKHDRLWADLAFRSDVGSGGLSDDWKNLFTAHPSRIMLGTDTYTPERMYFIPDHANNARRWLSELPAELAERVAWKNAHDLIMPVWQQNRPATDDEACHPKMSEQGYLLQGEGISVAIEPGTAIGVSQPFNATLQVCTDSGPVEEVTLDAVMPAHGHGMNYSPEIEMLNEDGTSLMVKGLLLHMPGTWQWQVEVRKGQQREVLTQDFVVQ